MLAIAPCGFQAHDTHVTVAYLHAPIRVISRASAPDTTRAKAASASGRLAAQGAVSHGGAA